MAIFYPVLLGAGLTAAFFFFKFPYFLQDCRYIVTMLRVGSKKEKFQERNYTLLDCFLDQVQKQPHKSFIVFGDEVHSYLQVDQESNKVARALQAHRGSTMALMLGNEPAMVWILMGLFKINCAVSLLNTNIRAKSLLHCFNCCTSSVLIAGAEHREVVCEVLPELKANGVCVYVLGPDGGVEGLHNLAEKIQQQPNTPVPPSLRENISINSPALYIYTSGTTGLPKAGLVLHSRLITSSLFLSMLGVKSDDVIYIPLPLYHAAGLMIGLAGAIEQVAGITVVLRRKFSTSQFWKDCRKHNVTVFQYIGETMRYLCNTPKTDNDGQHKVRLAIGNGLRADVWHDFQHRFGPLEIREFYAASDGNMTFVNYTGKVGAVGRVNFFHEKVFPYALIRFDAEREEPVRNSKGRCVPVPTGETGLLVVKITKVAPFAGYAGNPEQTEKKRLRDVFQPGDVYLNSGDLLKIDHSNFIYFQDRVGDTFRWKGENVATTEVADVLDMLDFIEDANVYGVKIPGHEGRVGMAAVTLKEDLEFDCREAFNHVTNFLPVYARPRFIRVLESMELTGTFKQVKVMLVKEGFDPKVVPPPLYVLHESSRSYVPLTQTYYSSIVGGEIRF
ncbi:hypothetical protein MHYP_G00130330 [Metynnis hypsauchen]